MWIDGFGVYPTAPTFAIVLVEGRSVYCSTCCVTTTSEYCGTLTMLERYNGLGYASRGAPSPYIWSGTDQYKAGKYVRDGVYDPNHVDTQPGCAALIKEMQRLDPSIKFGMSTAAKAGSTTAIVVGTAGGAAAAASQGWSWLDVGLTAFIVAGIVTAIVLLIKKVRS